MTRVSAARPSSRFGDSGPSALQCPTGYGSPNTAPEADDGPGRSSREPVIPRTLEVMMNRRSRVVPLTAFLIFCFVAASACSSASSGSSASKEKKEASGADSAAAMVDGTPITQAELDAQAARQIYEIRQQTLDQMLTDKLLEKEAKAQGVTKEALMDKEVNSKVTDPTPAEVDQVWEANKARMPGKTKEQVAPDIIKWLKSQKSPALQQAFIQSLKTKYKVQVLLEAPRVQVAVDDDPAKGPADAPVTIVEFSDFQCPYCGRAEATVKQVLDNYKDKIRFVFRDYPLSQIHPFAAKAAEASECAHEQGKFWEFHDALYADQSKLSVPDLEATAARLGLNADSFKKCLDTGKYTEEVNKDTADAQKAGVNSTPSFFINGIAVVGAQGYQAFADVIDRELARKK
jgi:protein-disulfide isomerase